MRETRFIEQKKEQWQASEKLIKQPSKTSDKLYEMFIQIMDDLSFARTFYPNRSVRIYLNGLAQQIFTKTYKNRKTQQHRLLSFWTDELPLLMYESRRAFLISFLIFLTAMLVGGLSSAMNEEFAQVILGDSYIEMTKENIASGDPMAVYKQKGALGMSLGIAGNNLFVAFLTFILGLFFGIGTIIILIQNGVMVGAFQYFFIDKELFWDSFLTIWIHGTLEISAIIIGGAAGIVMGNGLLFPGTFSRIKSFQRSARQGLKIMMGIVPIILIAAFIEGYLTRNTDAPYWLRGLFILFCLIFVLGYFVWYPRWKVKHNTKEVSTNFKFQPDESKHIEWYAIKSISNIINETFELFILHFNKITFSVLVIATIYTASIYLLAEDIIQNFIFPRRFLGAYSTLRQFFINKIYALPTLVIVLCTVFSYLIYNALSPKKDKNKFLMLQLSFPVGSAYTLMYLTISNGFFIMISIILFPILFLWSYHIFNKNAYPLAKLGEAIQIARSDYGRGVGVFLSISVIGFILINFLDTLVFFLLIETTAWIMPVEQATLNKINIILLIFCTISMVLFIFSLYLIAFMIYYHVAMEVKYAINLKEKIQQIGNARKIRGIERETI